MTQCTPDSSFLNSLNEEQRNAVVAPIGQHAQILAGPGTGKTKVLASRVAWLLCNGTEPQHIIALTYNKAAAEELIARTSSFIGDEGRAKKLIAGTFHGVCLKYLYRFPAIVGLKPSFQIANDHSRTSIMTKIFRSPKFASAAKIIGFVFDKARNCYSKGSNEILPKFALEKIGSIKGHGMDIDSWADIATSSTEVFIRLAFRFYTEHLKESNQIDFDDCLIFGAKLFGKLPECVSNIRCILVDEFQDTNLVQFKIVRLLAGKTRGITVAGDPDQSIYGYRGATPGSFDKMCEMYPDTKVYYLQTNYRSFQSILDISMNVIQRSQERTHGGRTLNSYKKHLNSPDPLLVTFLNENEETIAIAKHIKTLTTKCHNNLIQYRDIAILVRYNSMMKSLESALISQGIPYQLSNGKKFWDFLEIKVILSYLNTIHSSCNEDDTLESLKFWLRKSTYKKVLKPLKSPHPKYMTSLDKILGFYRGDDPNLFENLNQAENDRIMAYAKFILDCQNMMGHFNTPSGIVHLLDFMLQDGNLLGIFRSVHKKSAEKIEGSISMLKQLVSEQGEADSDVHNSEFLADQNSSLLNERNATSDLLRIEKLSPSPKTAMSTVAGSAIFDTLEGLSDYDLWSDSDNQQIKRPHLNSSNKTNQENQINESDDCYFWSDSEKETTLKKFKAGESAEVDGLYGLNENEVWTDSDEAAELKILEDVSTATQEVIGTEEMPIIISDSSTESDNSTQADESELPEQNNPSVKEKDFLGLFLRRSLKYVSRPAHSSSHTADSAKYIQNLVVISTIHAAKGLEWPIVFAPKLSQTYVTDIEEERRVFFVALTRAAALLYLSFDYHSQDFPPSPSTGVSQPTYQDTFVKSIRQLKKIKYLYGSFEEVLESQFNDIALLLDRAHNEDEKVKSENLGLRTGLSVYLEEVALASQVIDPHP